MVRITARWGTNDFRRRHDEETATCAHFAAQSRSLANEQ
jgi:hypothetical protein